jgi:hypothetical protein
MDETLPAQVEAILNRLNKDQLILLNKVIVERLKLMDAANALKELSKFSVGDEVAFSYYGEEVKGKIIKLNRKTVSILSDKNNRYNVSPSLINRVTG